MKLSTKVLGITGGSLVLMGLAALGWNWHLEKQPTELEPAPKLPSPNAFDTLTAAGKLIIDGSKLTSITKREPLPSATIKTLLSEQQIIYTKNQEAIRLIKFALNQDYFSPPATSTADPIFLDQTITLHRSANLLLLEGQIKERNNDYSQAAQSYINALQLGNKTVKGRAMIGMLTGILAQKHARQNLYAIHDQLNLAETLQVLRRLKLVLPQDYDYTATLRSEKAFGQMAALEMMRKPGWRFYWPEEDESDPEDYPPLTRFSKIKIWLYSQHAIMVESNAYMDALIAQAQQDFSLRKAISLPSNPVSYRWAFNLTRVLQNSRTTALANQVSNDFLLVTFALHTYQLEYNKLPSTLSQLVPKYLAKIPSDSFASLQQLRYQRKGETYLFYSVGPDGNDDQGKPIDKKEDGYLRFKPQDDSKGDIVAGIND